MMVELLVLLEMVVEVVVVAGLVVLLVVDVEEDELPGWAFSSFSDVWLEKDEPVVIATIFLSLVTWSFSVLLSLQNQR